MDIAFPLPVRERLLPRAEIDCFGLLPRAFPEIDTDAVLPDTEPDLGLEFPLFLRSKPGIGAFDPVPARPPLTDNVGTGLPLGPRLSKAAFMSVGIGTWWIILTDRQSAAWIMRCSLTVGGRQHPGHPGL